MTKEEFEQWFQAKNDQANRLQETKTKLSGKLDEIKRTGQQAADQLRAEGIDPKQADTQIASLEKELQTEMDQCEKLLTEIDTAYQKAASGTEISQG